MAKYDQIFIARLMAHYDQIFFASLVDHFYHFSWFASSFLTPSNWSEDVVNSKLWSFLPWDQLEKTIYNKTINLITIQFYSNTRWSLLLWFYNFLLQWRRMSPVRVSESLPRRLSPRRHIYSQRPKYHVETLLVIKTLLIFCLYQKLSKNPKLEYDLRESSIGSTQSPIALAPRLLSSRKYIYIILTP